VVRLHLNAAPTTDLALIRARRGWSVVRRCRVLERALRAGEDLPPEPPAGVRVRPCADEPGRKQVHALYQAAFAEHFDFQPRPYERWPADIHADRLDWSLVWLASTEDLGDAGGLLTATGLRGVRGPGTGHRGARRGHRKRHRGARLVRAQRNVGPLRRRHLGNRAELTRATSNARDVECIWH
jgi:hypothetical protein